MPAKPRHLALQILTPWSLFLFAANKKDPLRPTNGESQRRNQVCTQLRKNVLPLWAWLPATNRRPTQWLFSMIDDNGSGPQSGQPDQIDQGTRTGRFLSQGQSYVSVVRYVARTGPSVHELHTKKSHHCFDASSIFCYCSCQIFVNITPAAYTPYLRPHTCMYVTRNFPCTTLLSSHGSTQNSSDIFMSRA